MQGKSLPRAPRGRLARVGAASLVALVGSLASSAILADDSEPAEVGGFAENATYSREDVGLSKFRNTVQLEGSKYYGARGVFSEVSVHGTFRGTYDGVYDMNEKEFGDEAGGAINFETIGAPAGALGPGAPAVPAMSTPWGQSPVSTGAGNFGFDTTNNPNEGLVLLGSHLHPADGGVTLGVPVRPCDVDSRGCIDDYLDFDKSELASPEFNDRLDFIREAYVDATIDTDDGRAVNFRVGRQQVVWGRTDLFRVLDVINPVDYSRNNIYDELEDIRIPMWIAQMEYRMGATESFDDLNMSLVWNFDKFRPSNLGQGGSTNSILDAGSFFRAMNNCWENGCTVSNFAAGGVATDFPEHVIGLREVHLPAWKLKNTQLGLKMEGEKDGLGFSVNALTYRSQLPSLRGGIPAQNPFIPEGTTDPATGEVGGTEKPRDYLIAFDAYFPRINLLGGSLDYYADSVKSVFRFEGAYTSGEEFANTLQPQLYSESDVFRWVLGWDRPTFIPFLNDRRAFLLSAQVFGQHLLDHELEEVPGANGTTVEAGIPDWKDNYVATFLIKGWYQNDRLSPQLIVAHDVKAEATTIAPSVEWLMDDNWQLTFGLNYKTGKGARQFDDCRACNPFPPYTAGGGNVNPGDTNFRLGGLEPLGRFRSGPIGMSQAEDEIQLTLRYRF